MKEKRNVKRVLRAIITLLFLLLLCYLHLCYVADSKTDYNTEAAYLSDRGYARVFRVWELDYDAFVRRYGESAQMDYMFRNDGDSLVTAVYPGFTLQCWIENEGASEHSYENIHLIRITVTDNTFRFGMRKIGIGSTRKEVQRAYKRDQAIAQRYLPDCPPADEGYYGEDWSKLLFCYDENGRVETMTYEIAGN